LPPPRPAGAGGLVLAPLLLPLPLQGERGLLKIDGEQDGDEFVLLQLGGEFAGAPRVADAEARRPEIGHEAAGEIGDEGPLRHMRAALERIAVEEDVARDGAALDAAEQVPGAPAARDGAAIDEVAAAERRLDARLTPIDAEALADAQYSAGRGIGEDVADRGVDLGQRVKLDRSHCGGEAPLPLLAQD